MAYGFKLKYGIFPAILLAVFISQGFSEKNPQLAAAQSRGVNIPDTLKNSSAWPLSFGLGRPATKDEIAKVDIDVRPDGLGLPPGSGNVKEGQAVYQAKCLACHGGKVAAAGLPGPVLITDSLSGLRVKTIGNYWPYASTIYDYINRAMPLNTPGSLTANEVYSLTAYLLYANKIIPADAIMNPSTLPKVKMPAEKLFVPDDRTGGTVIR